MSQQGGGQNSGGGAKRRRRGRRSGGRRNDVWRDVQPLGEPEPIVLAPDPTALLHSLGPPPLQSRATIAEYYLEEVIKKAQAQARGLAWTAGVLSEYGVDLVTDVDENGDGEPGR